MLEFFARLRPDLGARNTYDNFVKQMQRAREQAQCCTGEVHAWLMADVIAKLMRAAEAAEAAARATLVSPEEERVIIDAAEALAGSDAGVPAKTRAVVLRRETKWLVFLDKHGAEYKWDVRKKQQAPPPVAVPRARAQCAVAVPSAQWRAWRYPVPDRIEI